MSTGELMTIRNDESVEPLRLEEAASKLRVSHWTVRNWCQSGRIAHHRIGPKRIMMIDREEIARVINESRVPAA